MKAGGQNIAGREEQIKQLLIANIFSDQERRLKGLCYSKTTNRYVECQMSDL